MSPSSTHAHSGPRLPGARRPSLLHQACSLRSRPQPARRARLATVALFTGIVQGKARVVRIERQADFSSISVEFPPGRLEGAQVGASVAVNGTCLTLTATDSDVGRFDIIAETLRKTSLGGLQEGSWVNFERSARVGDEIGGHNVSGHVSATATLTDVQQTENNRRLTFQVPRELVKYILPKGFIAVDGISLTVGEVGPDWFCVYLIPETLRVTVLGERREGDAVNIEIDSQTQAIVDTVEKVVAQHLAAQQLPVAAA